MISFGICVDCRFFELMCIMRFMLVHMHTITFSQQQQITISFAAVRLFCFSLIWASFTTCRSENYINKHLFVCLWKLFDCFVLRQLFRVIDIVWPNSTFRYHTREISFSIKINCSQNVGKSNQFQIVRCMYSDSETVTYCFGWASLATCIYASLFLLTFSAVRHSYA